MKGEKMHISVANTQYQEIQETSKSQKTSTSQTSFDEMLETKDDSESNNIQEEKSQNETKVLSSTEIMQNLVEDIESVMRTGVSIDEIEKIEGYLNSIKEYLEGPNANNDLERVEEFVQKVKDALSSLKHRMKGSAMERVGESAYAKVGEFKENIVEEVKAVYETLKELNEELKKIKSGHKKDTELVPSSHNFANITTHDFVEFMEWKNNA